MQISGWEPGVWNETLQDWTLGVGMATCPGEIQTTTSPAH